MTHYDTLGVPRDAAAAQIKAAFRKLASEHHPDRGGDTAKAAAVNDAYACLSDSERRARYDAGHDDVLPPTPEQLLRQKALEVLGAVFDAVLERPDIESTGLIRTVRVELTAAGKRFATAAIDARAAVKKLDRIRGKLLRKAGAGDDIASMLLEGKATTCRRRAEEAEVAVGQVNAATALLAEYGEEPYSPGPAQGVQMGQVFLQQQFNDLFRARG